MLKLLALPQRDLSRLTSPLHSIAATREPVSEMSEIDDRFVKRGQWTNVQEGSVLGQTITTDTRTGIIIVALLAVLSTIGK